MNGLQSNSRYQLTVMKENMHIMLRVVLLAQDVQVGVVKFPNFIALILSYLYSFRPCTVKCLPRLQFTCFLNLFQLIKHNLRTLLYSILITESPLMFHGL